MAQGANQGNLGDVTELVSGKEKGVPPRDEHGRRLVVRNGLLPERDIVTGIGLIPIRQPRIDDRRLRKSKGTEPFTSTILPRYLRRIPSIDNLIPALYL